MTKTAKRQFGDLGEDIACIYLKNKGFSVICRNYQRPWGEIDVIAERAGNIHFVEVKTVSRESLALISPSAIDLRARRETGYRPEENVHPAKIKRLHRAIQTYLVEHNVSHEKPWQLDIACVYLVLSSKKAKVEMLENVIV